MKLDRTTFLGRMLRKTGKLGIGLLMMAAFLTAGFGLFALTVMTSGVWYPKSTLLAAFGAAYGVYAFFGQFKLIPNDTEPFLVLSLEDAVPVMQEKPPA